MKTSALIFSFLLWMTVIPGLRAQDNTYQGIPANPKSFIPFNENKVREIPVLRLPEKCRNTLLPPVVDNSANACFSGIYDQGHFFSCEQHHCVYYAFGYEINRLRGLNGRLNENLYPSHYTFNFFNNADPYQGVSYYYSMDILSEQGHMTEMDYGSDDAMKEFGWPSGYDKYYNGMHNRLGGIYTIPMTTEEGQNTLKHYLYDHLEGSPVGGVALFAANSPGGGYFRTLPKGTPEADKPVTLYFDWFATHGGTVMGYNDSIRYDINNDGKYTNNIDINNDGVVDIRDWEIGGFRIANSYGDGWGDQGFYYVLYSAMAYPYGAGGIENGNVVVLQPLADYQPLMTMKASFRSLCRDHFRILAGVSADTSLGIPEHEIDFPMFNYQGNCHTMQGLDTIPGSDTIEFGLDVTPLLSYIEPGKIARFFLVVENKDSAMNFGGEILHLSFINYTNGTNVYNCPLHDIPCIKNSRTYASVTASPQFDKVRITTTDIPLFSPGQAYQEQLQCSGGIAPYHWSLDHTFSKLKTDSVFTMYPGSFPGLPNIYTPYIGVPLPFSFPFSGKRYDTAWVNTLGLISFENKLIPYEYTTDDLTMLKTIAGIFPAFSRKYFSGSNPVDSMCLSLSAQKVVFRWFMRVNQTTGTADNNMELVLYPDGRFEVRYGLFTNPLVSILLYTGWSAGDGQSFDIAQSSDRNSLQSQSFTFIPASDNDIFHLSESGLLTAENPDTTSIYTVNARVEDGGHQHDNKVFQISSGLGLTYSFADGWDGNLNFNVPVSLNLTVVNKTQQDMQNLSLRLACTDTAIHFQDSLINVSLLTAGNQVQFNHAFTFRPGSLLTDLSSEKFTLQAATGSRDWVETIILPVVAPAISVLQPDIIDGDNHHLDPGEVAELEITLLNSGHAAATHLSLNLLPQDTLIRILSDPSVTIEQFNPPGNLTYRFLVKASSYAVSIQNSILSFKVTGDNIRENEFQFSIPLGRQPVAIARLSQSSVSLQPMLTALDSLNVPNDVFTSSNFDPLRYRAVFLLNGTNSYEHYLTALESVTFSNYLNKGGNLYMEGYSTWSQKASHAVLPYFQYTSDRIPAFFYSRFKGCARTFASGMYFSYENDINGSVYDLKPMDSASTTFENYDSSPHSLQVTYDKGGYKTIASLFEFGGLNDSVFPSSRKVLMQRYLDFFNVNLSGPFPLFHATKTRPNINDTLTFVDDSYPDITSWQWEFKGASPASSSARNPVVSYPNGGSFDVSLTVSNGIKTESLTRKNFIIIPLGTSISNETPVNCLIYPNPAKDFVTICLPGTVRGEVKIEIFDICGLSVLSETTEAQQNKVVLNTSSLKQGMYILKTAYGTKKSVVKLLVQ